MSASEKPFMLAMSTGFVPAELRPRHLLDELFERADAAGKRHECVRLLEHQAFSLVHVLGHDRFRQVCHRALAGLQKRGMMPVTVPPASSTARAVVPIRPTEPPP